MLLIPKPEMVPLIQVPNSVPISWKCPEGYTMKHRHQHHFNGSETIYVFQDAPEEVSSFTDRDGDFVCWDSSKEVPK